MQDDTTNKPELLHEFDLAGNEPATPPITTTMPWRQVNDPEIGIGAWRHTEATTPDPIDLQDLTAVAREIVEGLSSCIDREALAPDARRLWEVSQKIHGHYGQEPERERDPHLRVAYLIALDALLVSPDAVYAALRLCRAELVRQDPALAIIAAPEVNRDR